MSLSDAEHHVDESGPASDELPHPVSSLKYPKGGPQRTILPAGLGNGSGSSRIVNTRGASGRTGGPQLPAWSGRGAAGGGRSARAKGSAPYLGPLTEDFVFAIYTTPGRMPLVRAGRAWRQVRTIF